MISPIQVDGTCGSTLYPLSCAEELEQRDLQVSRTIAIELEFVPIELNKFADLLHTQHHIVVHGDLKPSMVEEEPWAFDCDRRCSPHQRGHHEFVRRTTCS